MTHAFKPSKDGFHVVKHRDFSVTGLPAFNDNYIWVAASSQDVAVVDPGDAAPVIDYCRRHGLVPSAIWLTHHHADHTGGVAEICDWVSRQSTGRPLTVYGPAIEEIPEVTHPLNGGECICLGDIKVDVLSVPGHTRGHLAYLVGRGETEQPALFSGDLLFGLGCGRLFEGTAAQMHQALSAVSRLPPKTRIYCAHEYTLLNLPFALVVDSDNSQLKIRAENIRRMRAAGEPTVPLTLAEECETNPFLRSDQTALVTSAMVEKNASAVDVFAALRKMRDTFKPPQ